MCSYRPRHRGEGWYGSASKHGASRRTLIWWKASSGARRGLPVRKSTRCGTISGLEEITGGTISIWEGRQRPAAQDRDLANGCSRNYALYRT